MAAVYGLDMGARHDQVVAAAPSWSVEKARDAYDQRGRDTGIPKPRWVASEIVKLLWRSAHPQTVQYWRDLQDAAVNAVLSPGKIFSAGRRPTRFRMAGSFLWAQLPSKRVLCFPYPEVHDAPTPWGSTQPKLSHMEVNSYTRKWQRTETYGGSLSESATQATARDCLRDAMLRLDQQDLRLDQQDLRIVMHVHDELVAEQPIGQRKLEWVEQQMAVTPEWATGLPIAAAGWVGKRFRKD